MVNANNNRVYREEEEFRESTDSCALRNGSIVTDTGGKSGNGNEIERGIPSSLLFEYMVSYRFYTSMGV